jgi:hypothetical protein
MEKRMHIEVTFFRKNNNDEKQIERDLILFDKIKFIRSHNTTLYLLEIDEKELKRITTNWKRGFHSPMTIKKVKQLCDCRCHKEKDIKHAISCCRLLVVLYFENETIKLY